MASRGLACYECANEGRLTGAVGVGRAGEPACKRHVRRRSPARSKSVALRRVATADRRARAARLGFLGTLRVALERDDVTLREVGEALGGVSTAGVNTLRETAERARALS